MFARQFPPARSFCTFLQHNVPGDAADYGSCKNTVFFLCDMCLNVEGQTGNKHIHCKSYCCRQCDPKEIAHGHSIRKWNNFTLHHQPVEPATEYGNLHQALTVPGFCWRLVIGFSMKP